MSHLFSLQYFTGLFVLFVSIFILRELVAFLRILPLKYVLTPLVTISIFAFAMLAVRAFGMSPYTACIIAGLLFSLVADTLLMIEEIHMFIHGLIFFLLTHCCYIAAFSIGYSFVPWHGVLLAVFGALVVFFYGKIRAKKGGHAFPVLLYMSALLLMCFFAYSHVRHGDATLGVLLPAAATLFAISDSVLAVNTFIKKIPHSTVLTWSLYAPAQFFIAVSCFF